MFCLFPFGSKTDARIQTANVGYFNSPRVVVNAAVLQKRFETLERLVNDCILGRDVSSRVIHLCCVTFRDLSEDLVNLRPQIRDVFHTVCDSMLNNDPQGAMVVLRTLRCAGEKTFSDVK